MGRRIIIFKGWRTWLSALVVCGTLWASADAGGISTRFAELHVENLRLGRVYSGTRDILGEPYRVQNNTDGPLNFTMVLRIPSPSELKPGFEPIPDASWITFEKIFFTVQPGESGGTDFYISVPTNSAHVGKKYQVQLGVNTFGGDSFVQMGLMGRALLTVTNEENPWSKSERKNHQFSAQMTLVPPTQAGSLPDSTKWVDFGEVFSEPLVVKNNGDYPLRVKLERVVIDQSFVRAPPGFMEAPPGLALKLRSQRLVIPPHSEAVVRGSIRVSPSVQMLGHYYITLRAVSERTPGQVEAFTRLFLKGAP
ncbi:MAG: hypothetical protein IPN19_05435 [Elusimicrobia bacterium]|nr:hypothetical protein [Elusimicrobiota bacterium]